MGFLLTAIKFGAKAIDLGLAGAQVIDRANTQYKLWKRKRAILKAIKEKRKAP